jgi:ribosomal protein S18 acetylase RimI-like enzyme
MEFRPATADDAEAVAALHADSWRRNYRGAFSDAFLDGDVFSDRRSVWSARLSDPGPQSTTLVADDDGTVVGFVHIVFGADPTWGSLVDNLHVSHTLKRSGVGRQLMGRAAAAVLARQPPTSLYLWVLEQNVAAQAFYTALGGSNVERGVGSPPGGGHPVRFRFAWPDPAVLVL